MSKSTLKILPALMVAVSALVAQPVFGEVPANNQLVITEYSSTSLTAFYNGSQLVVNPDPSFADQWAIILPPTFLLGVAEEQWIEPENLGLVNLLAFFSPVHGIPPTIGVFSDFSLDSQIPANADGAPVQVGTDGNVPVIATFTDLAAASEVPDTGTTFSLFGLSLTGLGFLRRKFC